MRQNVPIRASRIQYIALYIGALTARSRNIKPLCSNVHIQYDAASHSSDQYMDVAVILRKLFCLSVLLVCLSACGEGVTVTPVASTVAQAQTPQPTPKATAPDCTMQSGSFQLVATGFAVDTVGMALYKFFPCDHYALIFLPALAGASNSTAFTASPLPDFLVPATIEFQEASVHGYDNGVEQALMSVHVSAGSNVITYLRNGLEQGWTASGNKGIGLQVITVFLD
jgi:hypothetical protein